MEIRDEIYESYGIYIIHFEKFSKRAKLIEYWNFIEISLIFDLLWIENYKLTILFFF